MNDDKIMNKLIDNSVENKIKLNKQNAQRRNASTSVYGLSATKQAVSQKKSIFYIPINNDMLYHEIFGFKLNITPFTASGAIVNADINNVSLGGKTTTRTSENSTLATHVHALNITPSSHSHSLTNLVYGNVEQSTPNKLNIRIEIDGMDVTNAFISLGYLEKNIDTYGLYPTEESENEYFDILDICSVLNSSEASQILESGTKEIVIRTNESCGVDLLTYLKYSHVNR